MKAYKQVAEEQAAYRAMKGLVEVYEELSAQKMQEVRQGILESREYFAGLSELSAEVGADLSQVDQAERVGQAAVLLSSDEGLYGDIGDKVFFAFVKYLKENPAAEPYVLGKTGMEMMESYGGKVGYRMISGVGGSAGSASQQVGGSAGSASSGSATVGMEVLTKYKEVRVFYGEFESIATQTANSRAMSAAELPGQDEKGEWSVQTKYLYEPSLSTIARKFGEEIFAGVWDQTVREGELAQHASRLMHLDSAMTGIDKKLVVVGKQKGRIKKRISGKKQGTQYGGIITQRSKRKNQS